jgi:hypothetical protein
MFRMTTAIAAAAAAVILAAPALAKTEKISGMVCSTGVMDLIATTKKDMAWGYTLNYTWLSDDHNPMNNSSGRCVGSGGMVGGKYETAPYFCMVNASGGSKFMVRGMGGPKGSKASLYGGSGRFAGVSGTVTGGPRIKLPAPKGHLAACRHEIVERTLPD